MAGKARVRIYPEQVPDNNADASYLLQEGFEKRLAEYLRGDFGLCGVRAVAEIEFPSKRSVAPCSISRPLNTTSLTSSSDWSLVTC
jgi:hypothetical protein